MVCGFFCCCTSSSSNSPKVCTTSESRLGKPVGETGSTFHCQQLDIAVVHVTVLLKWEIKFCVFYLRDGVTNVGWKWFVFCRQCDDRYSFKRHFGPETKQSQQLLMTYIYIYMYISISLGYNNIASHPCQYNFTRSRLFCEFNHLLVLERANLSMPSGSYTNSRPGKWQQ